MMPSLINKNMTHDKAKKKAKELLNFSTTYDIEDMLKDAYLAELNNK